MIATVTSYGRGAASARVRVFDWLDRTGIPAQSLTYLGGARSSLGEIARRPLTALRAERALRSLVRESSSFPVLVSRSASPFSNGQVESALLRTSQHGVYDFDDALMTQTGTGPRQLFSRAKVCAASVVSADTVIAGNDYLADYASQHNEDVRVIPSCVEPDHYVEKLSYAIKATPVAVWMGSPSTEQYLQAISRPLLEAHRRTGLRLTLISAGDAPLHGLAVMVDRVDWNPQTYGAQLAAADVGIMPLPDDEWTRGKCAYKLLQYGAAALPVIGSPVGANTDALSRLGGWAASKEEDWVDSLTEIVEASEDLRHRAGRAARTGVEAHYSFARWEGTWLSSVSGTA